MLKSNRPHLQFLRQHVHGRLRSRSHRPLAASEGAAEPERDSGEFEPPPTSALSPQPLADRPEAASAEAIVESPPGPGRIGREPTAGPRRSAVADPGKTLLEEIMALQNEQEKPWRRKRQ